MTGRASLFPATQRLAAFTAALRYEDLPSAVREQLGVLVVDFFRVAAIGCSMPWADKLRRAWRELGGNPVSSILLGEERCDPVRAACLNGVIAGSLEWDDTHVGAMLHPGVVVWPSALAVGEMVGASGRDVAAAVAAGYEVMIRVGLSVQPSHFRRNFQSTATCGVFGAAAAAAKLLGLDGTGVRDALGLAASYAGGTTQFFLSGSEVKRLHAGKASAGGTEAALLAKAGLTGPRDAIEGGQGFARAFADGFDGSAIEHGLGSEFQMRGLTLKTHAGSARLQAATEAGFGLARSGVTAARIERAEIGIPAVIQGRLTRNEPQDLQQSQMSAPFAVAMAIALAPRKAPPPVLTLDDFEASVGDPDIRALARRIDCVVDAEIERATTTEFVPARVTVMLRDGRRVENKVMVPEGAPQRPLTWDQVRERFLVVAAPLLATPDVERWLESASDLAGLADLKPLLRLRARRAGRD